MADASTYSIPAFASGGVIPPNNPFLAVLGDNRQEPEVVAPYSTIKQAARDAMAERGGLGRSPLCCGQPMDLRGTFPIRWIRSPLGKACA